MQLNTKSHKHDFYLVLKDMVILCCNRDTGCSHCPIRDTSGNCRRVIFRKYCSIDVGDQTGNFNAELLYDQFVTMASFTCDNMCRDCALEFTSGCALKKLKSLFGET